MKTVLVLAALSALLLQPTASLRADAKSDLVEKYYQAFQAAGDPTGRHFVWGAFSKEVPPANEQEIMASIIDRGAKDGDSTNAAAAMLGSLFNGAFKSGWSAHLERAVLTLAHSKDAGIRSMFIGTLAAHDRVKHRALCLSYLDDPKDYVRDSAVSAIGAWPDGTTILTQYIQSHQSNPEYSGSVQRAKEYIGIQ